MPLILVLHPHLGSTPIPTPEMLNEICKRQRLPDPESWPAWLTRGHVKCPSGFIQGRDVTARTLVLKRKVLSTGHVRTLGRRRMIGIAKSSWDSTDNLASTV